MDPNRARDIYAEIGTFTIELEADPTVLGPKYLNELISRCRNYLNRVSSILLEIVQEKGRVSSQLRAEEAAFQVDFDEMLANDERVRCLPNIADRTSTIHMLLRDQRNSIEVLKRTLLDLEHIEKAVRHRHNELKSTNTDIKMQRQMVRDELDTGSFYGDESNTTSAQKAPIRRQAADDIGLEELDQLLRASKEAQEAPAPDVQEVPPAAPAPIEQEVATLIQETSKVILEPTPDVKTTVISDEVALRNFLASPALMPPPKMEESILDGLDFSEISNL